MGNKAKNKSSIMIENLREFSRAYKRPINLIKDKLNIGFNINDIDVISNFLSK
jgi:arsenate reductase-like glutaredoxin family protein